MIDFIVSQLLSLYYHMFYGILDFSLYVLVDIAVKTCLREARDDIEKRVIWLWETVILLMLCVLVYVCHHTPWLLTTLAVLTLLYTQLLGRINFRYWWWQLATRWDEFEQHEESMEVYNSRHINPPNVSVQPPGQGAPFTVINNRWPPPPVVPPPGMAGMMPHPTPTPIPFQGEQGVPQFEAWYPSTSDGSQQPAIQPSVPVVSEAPYMSVSPPGNQLHYRGVPMGGAPQQQLMHGGGSPYTPVMPRGMELTRKPLHQQQQQQQAAAAKMKGGSGGLSSKLKATFMTAFGMGPQSPGPPGLQNNGQNLCFINSVLQCLAYSPTLVDSLLHDSKQDPPICSEGERALLTATMNTLQGLNTPSHMWDPLGSSPQSTLELRRAATHLSQQSLVLDPDGDIKQGQQDAAEFLMWLLDALHRSLNTHGRRNNALQQSFPGQCGSPGSGGGPIQSAPPRFATWTLQMLKYIYGDLTPQRIHELKLSCRKEIEQANGLENDSYAEPIQRLSDLEWLTYKERNSSVVDDLFTGQLVEAQHCTACNRISVGIQTFNILPVPIVGPRQLNGIVYLEDCFTKFGTVEELFGPEGLQCDGCNQSFQGGGVPRTPPNHGQGGAATPQGLRRNLKGDLHMAAVPSVAASPELVNGGSRVGMMRGRHQPLLSDSALHSTLGNTATSIMSPIPNSGSSDVFSDSGFHDNQFRTSTPIHGVTAGGVVGSPTAPIKLTDGQRRSLLRQLPECLIVQLLRFTFHQGQPRKVYRPVSIPLVNLDLTGLIIDNVMKREDLTALHACFQYNLYGLALHLGGESTSYGHYISYALAADGSWYRFDDHRVQPVNMEYELNTRQVRENAYLLFYRKSVMAP